MIRRIESQITLIFMMILDNSWFPPNLPANKEGFKQFIYLLWKAFPDIRITFEDIIIEENKVACRYNLTGTHKGEFVDFGPTNKQFRVNGMTVFSFRDSKCIERWNLVDMMSLMQQLRTQLNHVPFLICIGTQTFFYPSYPIMI